MEIVYRCVVILCGLILFAVNLVEIAQKKMDVGIGSSWTVMALIVIIFGIAFDFSVLRHIANIRNIVLVYIFAGALVIALYLYGLRITELKKKNNEVAIWVSILKNESEFAEKDINPAEMKRTADHTAADHITENDENGSAGFGA